jgi:cAMP-dependent protein kinase regulator|tara:strand:+ start:955 stop:2637 length:1683 start_codon:yes stop_codon:yes gene_type:complete
MSRLDVAELEQRVRRRLAVTQHLDVVGGRDPVSLDAKKGHASTNCSVVASKRSFERRLPGDGGPPIPKAGGVDVRVVQRACDGISLFKTLRRDDRQRLYESMYQLEYEPGERVVRAGEDGRNFYVVVDGYLNVTVEDSGGNDSGGTPVSSTLSTSAASSHDDSKYSKYAQASYQSSTPQYTSHHPSATSTSHKAHVVINTLSPGDTFGEVSLLHSVPRSATVAAAGGRVKLWALDRRTFKTILQKCAFERRELNTALLRRVEILKGLDDYGLGLLSDACGYAFFQKGEMIFKQNEIDETTKFHVIERGAVSVRLSNNGAASGQKQEVNQLGKGSYFGEVSVLFGTAPTASVVASTDVSTLTLDRAAFKRMLGDDVLSAMTEFAAEYAYDEDITADFRKAGDPALKSGAYDVLRQHFASGAARRREDPTGRRARGERAMAGAASRERDETTSFMRWQESVTAGNSSGNFDKENAVESVSDKGSKPRSRSTICERDLTFHKELGVGMSGVVYLAKVKHTNAVCCVKVMRKRKLLRLEQATNITRELALSKAFGDDTNFIMQR